jgi:3-dehydroquinate synthase
VDASIGGKSAINFGGLKNIVGNFQLPRVVVIDPATLATLPKRELRSGFAEVIKHGALFDRAFFEEVTKAPCDSLSLSELTAIIARSCELKVKVVNEDERELGPRKLLNFGHTLGHAFEALYLPSLDKKLLQGDKLLHGESVAIGMVAEAFISLELGFLSQGEFSLLESAILRSGLPTRLPSTLSVEEVLVATSKDKKREAMEIKWSLIEGIGHGVFNKLAPKDTVMNAIRYVLPVR